MNLKGWNESITECLHMTTGSKDLMEGSWPFPWPCDRLQLTEDPEGHGWGSALPEEPRAAGGSSPLGKPDPGREVTVSKFEKTVSSEYLRQEEAWQGAPGPKTLFRFDLFTVCECYLWRFSFPCVFHQNNLILKKNHTSDSLKKIKCLKSKKPTLSLFPMSPNLTSLHEDHQF